MTFSTLAIHGGAPAVPSGSPPWPVMDAELRGVFEALAKDGGWGLYQGKYGVALVDALADMHQVPFVYPCSSGTFAVELALRSLGISAGDEVILAGYDFPGNFRAIEAVGALPVLVDLSPDSFCLDLTRVPDAIGPRTRAVLVSHLHGTAVRMRELIDMAAARQLLVVEDACQMPGSRIDGKLAGTWGDVGVLSFGGSKLLSAGRGGAILTRRPEVLQRAKIFCEQGNHAYPLSELQAAVLGPQLARLDERNRQRTAAVAYLSKALADLPGVRRVSDRCADSEPGHYKVGLRYVPEELPDSTRDSFIAALVAEGVAVGSGFRGFVSRSDRRCRRPMPLPHSQAAAEQTIVLHHPVLLAEQSILQQVVGAFEKVTRAFARS